MPIELGTTAITGRRPDFSLLTTPNGTVIGGDSMGDDILARLIVVQKNVKSWIFDNKKRLDEQHKKNMAAIDSDIDKGIKAEGGQNKTMDISTPNKIVVKEKNIVVKLYLTNESAAKDKSQSSKSVFGGYDVLNPKRPELGDFIYTSMMNVQVKQDRLVQWANAYEAARLAQVYSETARRLDGKKQVLVRVEAAQVAQATQALKIAKEQARLKQYPAAPPNVSLDQNLKESKRQNEYFSTGGSAFLFSWFYKQVRNGGDWDYKQGNSKYEGFGNFHYGAVGTAAGISEGVLLRAAGAAQTVAGTSLPQFNEWWSASPYGDDPVDQVWVKAGVQYAKSKGY
ncbi:hypothetical protein D3C85_658900 [compost metagenome]